MKHTWDSPKRNTATHLFQEALVVMPCDAELHSGLRHEFKRRLASCHMYVSDRIHGRLKLLIRD
jgi:hypothetical protein